MPYTKKQKIKKERKIEENNQIQKDRIRTYLAPPHEWDN